MAGARTLLQNLSPKGRLMLGGSVIAVVLLGILMMKIASAPDFTTVLAGMDPAQTGKITAALDAKGIAYELQNNGTALAVDKSQVASARVALATAGVSTGTGTQDGWSLFDNQKLGASQMQQQVTYQRALEGEVSQTINGVSGVSGAQVQLVLPQDDLFADQATPATAAVRLSNPADTLEPGAVQGIASLVSSSVKGLKSDNVTITDGNG